MSHTAPDTLLLSFKRMLMAAGDQAAVLKKSMVWFALAAVCEGLALSCFFPLMAAVFSPEPEGSKAWFWLGAMGLLSLPEAVARWTGNGIFGFSHHYARVSHSIRLRLGRQLREMPMEELTARRTGELTATLSGNVDEVTTPMGMITGLVLRSVLVPVTVMMVCLFYHWPMALILAVVFPLTLPLYQKRRRLLHRSMEDLAQSHARTASEILEYTQGLTVLRSANATGQKARRLRSALDNLEETQIQNQARSNRTNMGFSSLVELGIVFAMGAGAFLVAREAMALSVLAALLVLTTRFAEPLSMFMEMTTAFDYMDAGLKRTEALLAIPALPSADPPARPDRFDIELEQVSFQYRGTDAKALDKVSCRFPEKSFTALVGPSGSGKTTITRMIMRYADPLSGTVRLGGQDLKKMAGPWLIDRVSVVFQDVFLFDDTILNNIRMGNPGASDQEVTEAARRAGCHEFIRRLPQGYHTRVGDIGGRLSGGEKQRISIARALLKNTPIVILDEPTAALDTESEVAVQKAVDQLVQNRTVIVIAHRLSTIAGADQILVFDRGRLVQQGTHASLLAVDGRYKGMWQAQQAVKSWHLEAGAPAID